MIFSATVFSNLRAIAYIKNFIDFLSQLRSSQGDGILLYAALTGLSESTIATQASALAGARPPTWAMTFRPFGSLEFGVLGNPLCAFASLRLISNLGYVSRGYTGESSKPLVSK